MFEFMILFILGFLSICILYRFLYNKRKKNINKNIKRKLKIDFLHPDLGIGGAENLIVNAACALQNKGHIVTIHTSHHDITHCFEQTRDKGTLSGHVIVHGDWLPRTIYGKASALCTSLRMVYIGFKLIINYYLFFYNNRADVYIIDIVSLPVPFIRLFLNRPVLFYCHYPDKLLCINRKSILKKIYRFVLDYIEEITTHSSNLIIVNSLYTKSVVLNTFKCFKENEIKILYPSVNINNFINNKYSINDKLNQIHFVSINRFERKKYIFLAIEALLIIRNQLIPNNKEKNIFDSIKLIIAGGYDKNNIENIQYLQELKIKVEKYKLADHVIFLTSISNDKKIELLYTARAVIYTPNEEHFGIVPIEAMACGTPVIAVRSGGPLESIVDNETGYLCENNSKSFAEAMLKLITIDENDTKQDEIKRKMIYLGEQGKERVKKMFSIEQFGSNLNEFVCKLDELYN